MHNGEPQFSKSKFSVPVGNSRTTQEEWDRIFGKAEQPKSDEHSRTIPKHKKLDR